MKYWSNPSIDKTARSEIVPWSGKPEVGKSPCSGNFELIIYFAHLMLHGIPKLVFT